jgi:hypothetical protein
MTMTAYQPAPAPSARRPFDVLGLIAVIVALIVIIPTLAVFLIGLVPEMNAIWWLGIVLIPALALAGAVALILAIIGIVVGASRRSRYVLSVLGAVLGILMVLPIVALWIGPSV